MNFPNMIFTIVALLIAIIPHEVAHGYAAYLMGDDTAKADGRLSFNPLNHIDPLGLLSMVILRFGWAKAVPINPYKFKKNKKWASLFVSLAGVMTNFLLAFIFSIVFVKAYSMASIYTTLFQEILWYNVMLGVFNLVPLPPLDGSKALLSFFSMQTQYKVYKYEKYFYIVLVALLFTGTISKYISPIIMNIINTFIGVGLKVWGIA